MLRQPEHAVTFKLESYYLLIRVGFLTLRAARLPSLEVRGSGKQLVISGAHSGGKPVNLFGGFD